MSSDKNINIRISAKDEASSKLSGIGDKLKGVFSSTIGALGIGFGMAQIVSSIKTMVGEATKSEDALRDMENAIDIAGGKGKEGAAKFREFANSIQMVTTYTGEQIEAEAAAAIRMGFNTDKIEEATLAAIALAKRNKIDLAESFSVLRRVMDGTLVKGKQYKLNLDDSMTSAEQYAAVVKMLIPYQKLASKELETTSGKLKGASSAFGEVMEEMGDGIIAGTGLNKTLDDLRVSLNALSESGKMKAWTDDVSVGFVTMGKAISPVLEGIGKSIMFITGGIEKLSAFMGGMKGSEKIKGGILQGGVDAVNRLDAEKAKQSEAYAASVAKQIAGVSPLSAAATAATTEIKKGKYIMGSGAAFMKSAGYDEQTGTFAQDRTDEIVSAMDRNTQAVKDLVAR